MVGGSTLLRFMIDRDGMTVAHVSSSKNVTLANPAKSNSKRASAVRCTVAWALLHRHGLERPAWPEPARQSRSSHDAVRSRYPARQRLGIRPRCQRGVGHERLVLAGTACSPNSPIAALG